MEMLVLIASSLFIALGIIVIVFGTNEERGFLVSLGIFFVFTAIYIGQTALDKLYDNEKYLVKYILDHKCDNEEFRKKFFNEILKIKKQEAVEKVEKELSRYKKEK